VPENSNRQRPEYNIGDETMTAKDLFGVAIRIGGMVFIVYALFGLIRAVVQLTGLPYPSQYSLEVDLISTAGYFVLGLALVMGAGIIVRASYWRD